MKLWVVLLGVLVIGGVVFWITRPGEKVDDTPPIPEDVQTEARMFALLVGCTEYPYLKEEHDADVYNRKVRLIGPTNDVELLRDTFRDYLGVPEKNITTLSGWPDDETLRPTRTNILGHLKRLAEDVHEGDRVVFHFSGHGSQQPDIGVKDELDRLDEILLPADVRGWDFKLGQVPGSISDDVLWDHIRPIRDGGATVWLSFDCCHSGGAMRGTSDDEPPEVRLRSLEPDFLSVPCLPEDQEPASAPVSSAEDNPEGVVATSAAQSYQLAPEMVLPRNERVRMRRQHGVYTFLLARTLQRYGGGLTFSELHEHLLNGYQAVPWDAALPSVEGSTGLHVLARHGERGPPLLLRNLDGQLWMNAGAIRGFSDGTILDVYKPGQLGNSDARLGSIRIAATDFTASHCKLVADDAFDVALAASAPLPLEIMRVAVGDVTIPLAIVDDEGKAVAPTDYPDEVRSAFENPAQDGRFPRVGVAQAEWVLQVGAERTTLERVEAGFESPRFLVAPDALSDTLFRVFRAQSLRRLARGDIVGTLPDKLTVTAYTAESKDGERTPLKAGAPVTPGTYIGLEVRNRTHQAVDLTVLMLDANYGVGVAWPSIKGVMKRHVRFNKAQTGWIGFGPWWLEDTAIGMESLVVLAVPCDLQDPETHFESLAQAALPVARAASATSTELTASEVLQKLVTGDGKTRSASLEPQALAMRVFPWRTRWGPIHIPTSVRTLGEETDVSVRSTTAPSDDVPWFVGEHMAVLIDEDHADAIVTWSDGIEQIYLDAGQDDGYAVTPLADLAQRIADGTLEADLVLRMHPRKRVAWYAGTGEHRAFSLRLVDETGDPRAEVKHTCRNDQWHQEPVRVPWLTTANLEDPALRKPIVRRLHGLVRHP